MAIKIIVHYPETPEKQAQFDARVAKFHAEYVAQYIEKLNCPTEQKLKLLDAVAQTIMEKTEENLQSCRTGGIFLKVLFPRAFEDSDCVKFPFFQGSRMHSEDLCIFFP